MRTERGGKLNICRIYSRFYLWCSALKEQLFWAEQPVQGQAGNCSVNLRGIDPELAASDISDISDMPPGWDDTCQYHCHRHHHHRSTVFLENNSGLNDCENKSKLCPSGATLMIINKHFKRAALNLSRQLPELKMVKIMSTQTHLDLLIWSFSTFRFSALPLHLIYSQNCFKCLEDNVTVHKATLLFDDIQNQQHTQNNMWSKWFLDAIFSTLVIYLFKREIEW